MAAGGRPLELDETGGANGDDFEDIIDSPHGAHLHHLQVGTGDELSCADAEFTIEEGGSAEETAFDSIVGALQDVVMKEDFQTLLANFQREHCGHFEDTEENKLIYTELFKKYSDQIESHIESELTRAVPVFEMTSFLEKLAARGEGEIDGGIFDLLASLGDFETFKQQMISAKTSPESGLALTGEALHIHVDEDEEGEERPDLADAFVVSSQKGT
mmetsp:Transcript_128491/g.256680  ORF Transcript_128491/g.256680 Transcript_128491/m.256680 type:complete len:216 (+) Transcript_128491:33-680(+)|eukprot:CAMPEP_0172712270 /NCGR_PEP_ID=MMETSP1074-20121228/61001_1 /TAXON_ID=2916 /ORGANISM="Ceratium fusus, Strain PA161109" /LENGTH=215 /DNA_ID=CAMNT_0013536173 /DNA_START=32 /DNA_END=679 /DNA_ORIENTATION=-